MAEWNQALRRAGRRSVPWITGASLLGAAIWSAYSPAQGDPAQVVARAQDEEDGLLRLAYVSTAWEKVLQDVAEKTGSQLVMHDVPQGRYSRADLNKYDRTQAVQILNRELEPLGYRILEKDQFLTVMQIKRTRREYQRPVASVEALPAPYSQEPQFPEQGTYPPTVEQRSSRPQRFRDSTVRPVGYDVESSDTGSTTVSPQSRSAIDIAKQVHRAFGARSQLIDAGPNGMPAFTVAGFTSPDSANSGPIETLFTVEIDTDQNTLTITGSQAAQQNLARLVQHLDVSPLRDQIPPTLMAGEGNIVPIAQQLKGPLSEIVANRSQLAYAQGAQADPAQAPLPPATPQPGQPMSEQPAAPGRAGLQTLIGNLKGDVQIESLEDLDLLIIRGNTEDVEKVMEVIRQVENMAVGSLPEIHLLKLRHVDSQSLSTLMTTVYERLSELRNRNAQQNQASVAVIPVVTPNAVLVLAPGNAMEAVLTLAEELDQPVDPSHNVQVFHLKNAVAEDVAEVLTEFYTSDDNEEQRGLRTRVRVSADSRSNSIIVQAQPRDMTELAAVIEKIDKDEAGAISRLKVFPLKAASSDEMAQFLTAAFQSVADPRASTVATSQTGQGGFGGAQTQQNLTPKSVVLEFLAEDGATLLRSGVLRDIRFNSDPRTNSLMVTAPEQSLPLIEELVSILDKPSSAVAEVKVFQLKNTDAIDAVTLLDELFAADDQQTGGNQNQSTLGVNLMGSNDISNLVPLRFSVDARSNSVVAYGGAKALLAVEAVLLRLDATDSRNRVIRVVRLHNSDAVTIAEAMNTFLQNRRDLLSLDPDRISTSQLLAQEYVVTAESITNSLVISATPEYLEEILELAEQLDKEPSQVVMQAMIVEVTLDNTDEFGVELGFQDTTLFDRSIANVPGFNFNNNPLGLGNVRSKQVGSQGLSNFALGRTNGDLGYGGLVLSASSENISVLVRALAARRDLKILSRPQVLALDNTEAQIQVGQVVPVIDGVSIVNNVVNPTVTRDNAGIILTVRPRVSPDGQVFMSVVAEKSFYDLENGVPIFVDGANGNVVESPIKNISTAYTAVKVPDGQTIVLGGMITNSDTNIERKVPYVGDIPVVGQLFRYDNHSHVRTELLIFLTPRVIRSPADFEYVKQVESDRMHWFQDVGEQVHGPIFGVPPEMAMPADFNGTMSPHMLPQEQFYPGQTMHPGIPSQPGEPLLQQLPQPTPVTPDYLQPGSELSPAPMPPM